MVNWRGLTNWHLLMKNIHKFILYFLPWLIAIYLMCSWERIVSLDLLQYVWYILERELPPLVYCNISDMFMWENCLPWLIAICLIYSWERITSLGFPLIAPCIIYIRVCVWIYYCYQSIPKTAHSFLYFITVLQFWAEQRTHTFHQLKQSVCWITRSLILRFTIFELL